jgi:hypothetical protein
MEKTVVIRNDYDGPRKPPKQIAAAGQFKLDFAYSDKPEEVDEGIRETIRGVKLSIMAMGIALYRLNIAGLYIDLGFRKFGEYIDGLVEDTGMSRANLYNWVYIGEAFVTHRAELEKIGFSDDDGPTKLPYLDRALNNHTKREVYKNLVSMSRRQFEEWSKGAAEEADNYYTDVKVNNGRVFAGDEPLVAFSEGISPEDRRYYEGVLKTAVMARENNEVIGVYRFYDESERRRFDRVYDRELKAMRAKK